MASSLSIIGVFREGDKLILVDAAREQYEVESPQQLWDDICAITSDPNLPRADLTPQQIAGSEDILADTCDRLGDAVTEKYGLLAGRMGAEATRRMAPVIINGLRKLSKRKRLG